LGISSIGGGGAESSYREEGESPVLGMAKTVIMPSQAQLKRWGKLQLAKYREREGLFLAEGGKVVAEALAAKWPLEALLILESKLTHWQPLWESVPLIPCYRLSETAWHRISQDRNPEGIMAVVKQREPTTVALPTDKWLLLYQISNPNNLGALLRSAHWFGFRQVGLSTQSTEGTHPKVVRTSMGSLFHLLIQEQLDFHEFIPQLRAQGIRVVATHVASGSPPRSLQGPVAVVLGNETHGLPPEIVTLTDECWHIPGQVPGGSLSLPQAGAIIMYELAKGARY